jgi:glyoxylase-like metal-dependent hydrolase (beta-lactamase superfamily II)
MIFRQLFDTTSSTYTYLIASRRGGEAVIVDPVLERVERYIKLLEELDLRLIKAIDTHLHADHITGLGELRNRTKCITVMGEMSGVDVVSMRVTDGEQITVEGMSLETIYTPGHTNDSYSFLMQDRVFTGDTLLIRGTGRTDFQNGSAADQYHSIFNRLLKLPDETLVYPAHDYKGDTVSTIGEERAFNPRLQVTSVQEYVDIMSSLKLPNPKMMDVAIPANLKVGLAQDREELNPFSVDSEGLIELLESGDNVLIDLRDRSERARHGVIPGSVHAPYSSLTDHLAPGGLLFELSRSTGKRLIFYCAFGERSVMAIEAARNAGLANICHLKGGIGAWKLAQGPVAAA